MAKTSINERVVPFPKSSKPGINFPYLADLLKVAQTRDPAAHVSGGCMRDMILKREIKDIDIFIHHDAFEETDRDFLINRGFSLSRSISGGSGFSDPTVRAANDYKAPGGIMVSLISMAKPMTISEHLERHDFGICRVAFDGRTIIRHPDFDRDAAAQEFVLRRCESQWQFDRSLARYARLSKKYPGWRLVVPESLKFFSKQNSAGYSQGSYCEHQGSIKGFENRRAAFCITR
jgi:hypothetical protein